ncbi:hypothetical protein HK100_011243 [Physocladia obscura]|uniref:beta-glucosidase n=1 Tax=Physocladia obscura TaxID=109957 RepID=A0AAD5XIG0_9FUNG|nr:hypothetical protein HK100_011243 [Physocladia obscura]
MVNYKKTTTTTSTTIKTADGATKTTTKTSTVYDRLRTFATPESAIPLDTVNRLMTSPRKQYADANTYAHLLEPQVGPSFKYPADFLWGFATASYQIEGAVAEEGRGRTIWDEFCDTPGKVIDATSGATACDSFHRVTEDVALLKAYGVKAYRFSFAWSRIIPLGGRDDPVNPLGIAYYNRLIDTLLAAGITPFATLYHWDLPLALAERYNGLLNSEEFPKDFERYARVVFQSFGDRVKHWLTFNEPYCSSKLGYGWGNHAPGRTSDRAKNPVGDTSVEPWRAGHSILLAHARAVNVYRTEFQATQGGKIAITLNCDWGEPYSDSEEDKAAAVRYLEFYVAWFADPIFLGDYPESLKKQLGNRLPAFSEEEKALVKGSADFFGLNSYTTRLVENRDAAPELDDLDGNVIQHTAYSNGTPIGPRAESVWLFVVPWGLRKLLNWLDNRYDHPDIFLTENGCSVPNENNLTKEELLNDQFRVNFYKGYLNAVQLAINDGVKIKSYFAWSLLDNFEWADGLQTRFGCTYVDFDTFERIPKASARFVSSHFKAHTIEE